MKTQFRLIGLLAALVCAVITASWLETPVSATETNQRSTANDFDCTTTDIPASECEALVALFEATSASAWWASTLWLKTPDVCDKWAGVICDTETRVDSRVTGLLLRNLDLVGEIPEELAQLTKLESLVLSENLLGGDIPSSLGQLQNLSNINLRNNLLSGSIPPDLADAPNLTTLLFSNNSLTGPIPEALLGNCVGCPSGNDQYGFLELANNSLSGPLPRDIGRQTITRLDYRGNPSLDGSIPDTYPQLQEITHFYIHGTGVCIPSDPDILEWLDSITTIISTQPDCSDFEYVVSGYVLGSVDQPLDNAWVSAAEDLGAFTDQDGYFEFTVPGGDHTISVELENFTFVPSSIEITVPPDATDLLFRGFGGNTISGRITDSNGQPVANIGLLTDTLDGGFTDANGEYVIDMLDDGTYEVEPFSAQYEFVPPSRTVTVPPAATGIDFVAMPVAFDPKVWADGPGWSTSIDPEIDDILKDLTPDTTLTFTCPDGSADCQFANAYVVLASETGSRCNLFRVTPQPTAASETAPDTYEAWLKMALPLEIGRCSGLDRMTAAEADGSLLSFFAGQEAFLFAAADAYLTLAVAGPTATVRSEGQNTFSVDSQPDQGRTTIAVYSGRLTVTPANASLPPFDLTSGQVVTVRAFDVTENAPLPQLYLPAVQAE